MGETKNKRSRNKHPSLVGDTFDNSERLIQFFSRTSAIGFAILDGDLRYEAINECLAAIHGIPVREHLGHTVREVLGGIAVELAPRYERALASGERLCFEITNAMLPTRIQGTYWRLKSCFPIRGRDGKNVVGVMAVDVTDQRKIETFLCELAAKLHDMESRENFWVVRELHDSIEEYHLALALSLELLVRKRQKSTELLMQSVEDLDQRIMTMRAFTSSIASRFSIR